MLEVRGSGGGSVEGGADFRLYCLDLHGLPLRSKSNYILDRYGTLAGNPCSEIIKTAIQVSIILAMDPNIGVI